MEEIEQLEQYIKESRFTIIVTGAGISNASGIKDMEQMNVIEVAQTAMEPLVKMQPERSYKLLSKTFLKAMFEIGPSLTHKRLAELEQDGYVQGIITTNIDCLHTFAGSKKVAEIQGSYAINRCVKCKKHFDDVAIWNQGHAPRCNECGGIIVSFPTYSSIGLNDVAYAQAEKWMHSAELVIIIGAKGSYGSYFQQMNKFAKIVQINPKATQFDSWSVMNIKLPADEVFVKLTL
jgi:NAD-dependent deacetylase